MDGRPESGGCRGGRDALRGRHLRRDADLKEHHETVLVGPDGPRVVSFGADFIFCRRDVSRFQERRGEALEIIRARCVLSPDGLRFGNDWTENLAAVMVNALDFLKGETLEETFRRVVLRERA